jgi:predicted amidohydrolase
MAHLLLKAVSAGLCAAALLLLGRAAGQPHLRPAADTERVSARGKQMVRIGTAQPRSRLIDWHLAPAAALEQVDRSLADLGDIVERAADRQCDVIALPEDTLGLGHWEAGNKAELGQVLPEAVHRMLERLGRAAAAHRMYLVCCNDTVEPDGSVHNTSFFLGRDGKLIGRYWKVNMPIHELDRKRGDQFPVFETPDLGGVGMLICYDMVFPEAARCLTLGGADIIFHPTLGGAAIGDEEISRAAFRTRAVENFVYLVVSQRGSGAMIVSPQGKILAEGHGPDDVAIADLDPRGGREGGDAMNSQQDMRARLFRERSPAAFGMLVDPNPPVLAKVPETMSVKDAVRISAATLTTGDARFREAEALLREEKTAAAIRAFEKLRMDFPQTWVDRAAQERLGKLLPARGK